MANQYEVFETHPQAVDKWLAGLPVAHVGETARQLYVAMHAANKQENLAVKHHFHLLEGIAKPLSLILPELHKHYAGKPLPLSQKRRKVADLYTQLLRQAVLGYQHVIAHSIELSRFGWKKIVTTSVHRIFHFSSLTLSNYRLLYLPYQKGMWQQLYWIYQLIEKYNLVNSKVMGLGEDPTKSTIDAEFKKLLLYSLLSPNLFRQNELRDVVNSMDLWIQFVAVSSQHLSKQTQTYAFTLETDLAPGLLAKNTPTTQNQLMDVRFLDVSALLSFIHKQLAQCAHGTDTVKLTRQHSLTRRTLIVLLNNWGRPSSRDGERRNILGHTEVAIGINAIHYLISDGRYNDSPPLESPCEQNDDESPFTLATPELTPQGNNLGFLGFTAEQDKKSDVWDSAYFVPETPAPSWTESMRMKIYSYLNAKVLNVSKGGFCIALPQDGVEHIQMNELVAVRGKTGQWQLGEIRWLVCPSNAAIRAGIRRHALKVQPAFLHIQTRHTSPQPIKCLVGDHDEGKVLFLSNFPTLLEEKTLMIELYGVTQPLTLGDQLYHTPVGVAYFIELEDNKQTVTDINETNTDKYASIWASL